MLRKKLLDELNKYNSIIIWGLKNDNYCTYRHIQRHLFNSIERLGKKVIWCDDDLKNNEYILDNSLIFGYNLALSNLQFNKNNEYVLLNTPLNVHEVKDNKKILYLRVYGEVDIDNNSEKMSETVFFDIKQKILHQTWATDLFPEDFYAPIFNNNKVIYWVGSIWNDSNNSGNKSNIEKLKKVLREKNIFFQPLHNISDEQNIRYIRESRIAPSIGGEIQDIRGMLPCRVWKNISYGQLGVTNLRKSKDVFKENIIYNSDIESLINISIDIDEKKYKKMTLIQQDIVSKQYTYINWLHNVCISLSKI